MGIINVNVGNSVSKVKYLYGTYADHLFVADYYNNYEDNNWPIWSLILYIIL